MLAWMLYVTVVSLLLAGAALAAERAAQIRGGSTRWVWTAGIAAALLLPSMISSVSVQLPRFPGLAGGLAPPIPFPLRQMTVGAVQPSAWLDTTIGPLAKAPSLDAVLGWTWLTASAAIFLSILAHGVLLRRRQRAWERRLIDGVAVHVSDDVGPAVIGLLRPRIVVPRWIAEAQDDTRTLVLAHERAHLEAGDAQLLAIAIVLIAAMPWNLPLWCQLRRLRLAIEMDCDARVLRQGHDVGRYGETLILVGERQSRRIAVVAAMSESKSFLEQRIRKMLRKPTRLAWAGTSALATLAFVLAASAAEVRPPTAAPPAAHAAEPLKYDVYRFRHYRSPDGRFEIDVPDHWNEAPPAGGLEVIRFLSEGEGVHDVLVIFRGPYDPAAGLEPVRASLVQGGFGHIVQGEAPLGSRAVQTLEFDKPLEGGGVWHCRYFVFPAGKHMYILGFGTSRPAQMFPVYDRLAATFAPNETAEAAPIADHGAPAHAAVAIRLVDDSADAASKPGDQRLAGPDGLGIWVAPDETVTPAMFASAKAVTDADGRATIEFTLTPEGRARLAELTRRNVGRRLALVVNGKVMWAPMIRDEIAGGAGQIGGRFTEAQAEALARAIAPDPRTP